MAQPTITIKLNTGTNASPTWTTVGADTITFTGSGSSDGDLKPIPRPVSPTLVTIAHELWVNSGTDLECSAYDGGGQSTDSYTVDMFSANPAAGNIISIEATVAAETQAAELEAWDNTSYNSTTNEILAGTTNLGVHSQLRAVETANKHTFGETTTTVPSAYQAQTAQQTTWQLQGSTRKLTFTAALAANESNRITFHNFIVDDSLAGSDQAELTYKYYYT